jgi:hypothetical protein
MELVSYQKHASKSPAKLQKISTGINDNTSNTASIGTAFNFCFTQTLLPEVINAIQDEAVSYNSTQHHNPEDMT